VSFLSGRLVTPGVKAIPHSESGKLTLCLSLCHFSVVTVDTLQRLKGQVPATYCLHLYQFFYKKHTIRKGKKGQDINTTFHRLQQQFGVVFRSYGKVYKFSRKIGKMTGISERESFNFGGSQKSISEANPLKKRH